LGEVSNSDMSGTDTGSANKKDDDNA
jgi:hypothetical protein